MLSLIIWRWFYLPDNDIVLVNIVFDDKTPVSALDKILKKHTFELSKKPSLIAQFRYPNSTTNLTSLWINRCEVSQAEFGRFISWQALTNKKFNTDPEQKSDWTYQSQTSKHKILGQLNSPVSGVSFFDAFAYCQASGGRLPSADEFEAISTGRGQRLYPWGNKITNEGWHYYDPVLNVSRKCGDYKTAISPENIADLGTNVSEWTTTKDGAIIMGGNAYQRPAELYALASIRRQAPKDFRSQFVGFRCVYPAHNTNKKPLKSHKLPWKGKTDLVFIPDGTYQIGVNKHAKIPQLLRSLKDEDIAIIKDINKRYKKSNAKIMRFETNVAQYQRFLSDPLVKLGFYNHKKQPDNLNHKPDNWQQQQQQPTRPIVNISWWSAWAFAKWAGGRLPSVDEWRFIASADLTQFPYGNHYQKGRAVDRHYQNPILTNPLSVNSSQDGGKNKVLGLSGNVAEWTNSTVLKDNTFLVLVNGGSYLMPESGSQVNQSSEAPPNYKSGDLGFRVIF